MYKKRIAEWGLRKYSGRNKGRTSSNESGSHRPVVGDQGNPTRRHRRSSRGVPAAKSQNQFALSRNRRAIEQDLDTYLRSKEQNLSYARFRTISQDLENFEIILTQIDNYYNSYSPSDWARTFPKTARASIKEIPLCFDMQMVTQTAATALVRHPGEVFNRIHMAAELLRINTPETCQLAWRMIEDAFDMVKSVLVQQHPQLLRYLFMQFWDQTFDAHPDIRRQLFVITSEMADFCLGPRHPITVIARLLPTIKDGSQICELAWKRNLDTFDALLGPNHDESLRSKMALTGNLIDAYRYDDAERVLRQIVNLFEPESTAYYNRAALCRIAWLYKLQSNFSEAETLFIDVLERCRTYIDSNPGTTLDEVYLAATTHLAQIQARKDYQQGERLLREALELCIGTMGPSHAYTYTIKSELADWKRVADTDALLDDLVIGTTHEH
jgi:tetratricopeptide (TPR) repeat protein